MSETQAKLTIVNLFNFVTSYSKTAKINEVIAAVSMIETLTNMYKLNKKYYHQAIKQLNQLNIKTS